MSNSLVWAIAKKIEWFCLRQCWDRKTFCLGCKLVEDVLPVPGAIGRFQYRADSRFALSQWETSLQSNAVSHWLGANLKSALALHLTQNSYLDIHKAKKQILRSGIRIISSLWSYIRVLGIAPQRAYRVITTNVTASFLHLSNAVTSFWRKFFFFLLRHASINSVLSGKTFAIFDTMRPEQITNILLKAFSNAFSWMQFVWISMKI